MTTYRPINFINNTFFKKTFSRWWCTKLISFCIFALIQVEARLRQLEGKEGGASGAPRGLPSAQKYDANRQNGTAVATPQAYNADADVTTTDKKEKKKKKKDADEDEKKSEKKEKKKKRDRDDEDGEKKKKKKKKGDD